MSADLCESSRLRGLPLLIVVQNLVQVLPEPRHALPNEGMFLHLLEFLFPQFILLFRTGRRRPIGRAQNAVQDGVTINLPQGGREFPSKDGRENFAVIFQDDPTSAGDVGFSVFNPATALVADHAVVNFGGVFVTGTGVAFLERILITEVRAEELRLKAIPILAFLRVVGLRIVDDDARPIQHVVMSLKVQVQTSYDHRLNSGVVRDFVFSHG